MNGVSIEDAFKQIVKEIYEERTFGVSGLEQIIR